jgi:hypothetical protein
MGTAQATFEGVLWRDATRSDRVQLRNRKWRQMAGSDVSHQNRKYILRMRNWKLCNIRPSGSFWPEVTSVT